MPSQFRSFADKSTAWLTVLSIAASCLTAQQSYAQERAPKILIAANNNSDAALAVQLYNQRAYGPATEAFERAIATSRPEPNLYYYAALANRGSLHEARAKQLFQYIVTNFPQSVQAGYARTALGSASAAPATASANSATSQLPDAVKAQLPQSMQSILNTPMGQQIVQDALKQNAVQLQAIKQAPRTLASAASTVRQAPRQDAGAQGTYAFSAQEIARVGADGIDQSTHPNCWFEASLSCLAALPRGQRLIASMIKWGKEGSYVVRFPNESVDYIVSDSEISGSSIKDNARWAAIIECAEVQKFHEARGYPEVGLSCLTGLKAETLTVEDTSLPELSSFVGGPIKSQNPVVAATYWEEKLQGLPVAVVPSHVYTVIDFDPSRNLITLRNPHGRNSHIYHPKFENADKSKVEQLGNGIVKMDLPTFQLYFHNLARSFI